MLFQNRKAFKMIEIIETNGKQIIVRFQTYMGKRQLIKKNNTLFGIYTLFFHRRKINFMTVI